MKNMVAIILIAFTIAACDCNSSDETILYSLCTGHEEISLYRKNMHFESYQAARKGTLIECRRLGIAQQYESYLESYSTESEEDNDYRSW